MQRITRSYRIRTYPNGVRRRLLDGHEWLAQPPSTCLTQCLRDQDRAFSNFFAGRAKYPKFKPKRSAGSLRFQGVGRAWKSGIASLPKLGVLKLAESLPTVDRPDMVTLSRDATRRYFLSFSAEFDKQPLPLSCRSRNVGVDLGLNHLAILLTGEKIENPKHYFKRLRYLRQQLRCLSRRQKGSKRREKHRLVVARAHAKVRQAREHALHELTTRLTRDFEIICIEDLNVKVMSRGIHSRSIHDASFGAIRRKLTYKSDRRPKILVEVDRWYPSSKTCSNCLHKLDELRLDVRQWTCPKCGVGHDRGINAAQNLLTEGLRQLAGCDDRDLCVDAGDACPVEIQVQVLADEARSERWNRACLEQACFH